MSFILDALKKSEAERLRQDAPGFSDVPGSPQEKSAVHWIWIIVVLIGINIIVLVVMFMRPDRLQESVASSPAAESASVLPSELPSKPASAASVPEIVTEANQAQRAAAAVEVTRDSFTPAVIAASQHTGPVPAVASSRASRVTESYATFNDLRLQGLLQLPDMHLDIHVYSSDPEDRFVFVNMSKYRERATLDEGPVVMEITPDGVILEYLGRGFLLPRE
jgi:general secretion pathway protein B